jgi:hypothetical protein
MSGTGLGQLGKRGLDTLEVGNASRNVGDFVRRKPAEIGASDSGVLTQCEQFLDFFEVEAERLRAFDKTQLANGALVVLAESGRCALGLDKQPSAFIEPDGFDADAGFLGEPANR